MSFRCYFMCWFSSRQFDILTLMWYIQPLLQSSLMYRIVNPAIAEFLFFRAWSAIPWREIKLTLSCYVVQRHSDVGHWLVPFSTWPLFNSLTATFKYDFCREMTYYTCLANGHRRPATVSSQTLQMMQCWPFKMKQKRVKWWKFEVSASPSSKNSRSYEQFTYHEIEWKSRLEFFSHRFMLDLPLRFLFLCCCSLSSRVSTE